MCLVKTNSISGMLIGSLSDKAEKADAKAQSAIDKSSLAEHKADAANTNSSTALSQATDALTKAGKAAESLGKAEDEANKAQTASSSALTLARGARQEADSFEKDIVSAKKQASDAESHLAEALRQAADATAELNRLKSPRSLLHESDVVSALMPFKGTEYMFMSVFADEESITLLVQIDEVLQKAGWKRLWSTAPATYERIENIKDVGSLNAGLTTGIQISINSTEPLTSLQSRPLDKLPQVIKAAVLLNTAISSNLFPPQPEMKVDVQPGTSGAIRITVGKKP
jgi:hypothetical protein